MKIIAESQQDAIDVSKALTYGATSISFRNLHAIEQIALTDTLWKLRDSIEISGGDDK